MTSYPHLFKPLTIGKVTLQNRIVVLPHGTSMVENGAITNDDIAYYEARARSGPGMIITGAAVVHPTSARRLRNLVENYSEHVLEGLSKRAHMIRSNGVVAVGQILHLGRELIGGDADFAPSAPSFLRSPRDPFPPHVLTEGEIAEIIAGFGQSALNLKRSGHNGVEIHAAHGYLVAQFLSPATNLRMDSYGGDPPRRMRFLHQIIATIREQCGDEFLLGVRLSADEEIGDGIGIADTARIAEALERSGGVDYISITLGTRGAYVKDVTQPEATAARAAGIIRKACGIPILVGQRITRPEVAERVLASGDADMVGMARSFIADADWVAKARAGETERIRPCLGLNQDCRAFNPHLHCAVNPLAGRELLRPFASSGAATATKSVAVIGAGPGGLEAARAAALRGHKVTLFEASDGIGGLFLFAASVPHRQDLRRLIDYYRGELHRLSVSLELGAEIGGPADLPAHDVVVIAVGAMALPVPKEFTAPHVKSWFDILSEGVPTPTGNRRAVMVDDGSGFWWNYGVAEALSEAGWLVKYVTPTIGLAGNIPTESVAPLLTRLGQGGTEFRVLSDLFAVTDSGAEIANLSNGTVDQINCDLVVVQTGRAPRPLVDAFFNDSAEVHTIGDCVTPRRMSHAVFEGQRLGLSL